MKTYYITIGNSDDKLTQIEWSNFIYDIEDLIRRAALEIFGVWFSSPDTIFQNACFSFSPSVDFIEDNFEEQLKIIKTKYRQDSIAVVSGKVKFI